jgi:hypothetical protein
MSYCGIEGWKTKQTKAKDSAFRKLMSVIAVYGLGHFTSDMLKKRLKTIKNVY